MPIFKKNLLTNIHQGLCINMSLPMTKNEGNI